MILIRLAVASALMVFFGAESWGADLRVSGGGFSDHLFSDNDYNERHNLLAVQVESVEVGRFDNSYDQETWYAAYEIRRRKGDWEGFIKAGLMYGYTDCVDPGDRSDTSTALCPLVVPGLRFVRYPVQPEIILVGGAVALTASVPFQL